MMTATCELVYDGVAGFEQASRGVGRYYSSSSSSESECE